MSRTFDYQSATPEQIADRLQTVQKQAYFRLIAYYTKKEDSAMVAKLEQGKLLSRILLLQREYCEKYPAKGAE